MKLFISIKNKKVLSLLILVFILVLSGCKKDTNDDTRIRDNKAFHDLMKEWYLWYDQMPDVNPANYISPYTLLEALRVYPPDRWSFVTSKKEFEDYFVNSKFIGYGFGSAYDASSKLRISFIFKTVELFNLGVQRGWIIKSINGEPMTGQNIGSLGANEIGVTNTFVFEKPDGTEVTHTVAKQEVTMNTVLHSEVIETPAGKVGYLVFQSFTGTSAGELETVFADFSTQGVSDIILDMRYNGGGSVNASVYLGSSLLSAANKDDVFIKYIHNNKKTSENSTTLFEETDYNMNLTRLFVIATSGTASASELIINGLKPYMDDVYVIGDDTHGKPTGMYGWYYDKYAFVPVTFETTNANDEGKFYDGIPADSYATDDTSKAFGDPEEASLKEALNYIINGTFSGKIQTKSYIRQPWEDFTGLRAVIMSH